jgi:hypothetical protein
MSQHHTPTVLNTERFRKSIVANPQFQEERSRDKSPENSQQRRDHLQRAIAYGALSIAEKLENNKGIEQELDASLFKLVAGLHDFNTSSEIIDKLRDKYDGRRMNTHDWNEFETHKTKVVMEFNRTLREVISNSKQRFNFEDLLSFMTDVFAETGGQQEVNTFYKRARTTLIGTRTEEGFEQVLKAAGVEFERGTIAQDAKGGDVIIGNVPVDVKSSEGSVEHAKDKALATGHNPDTIIWSHIEPEDFNGELTLSEDAKKIIFKRLEPALNSIIYNYSDLHAA